ncbi:hypothetical protein V1282_003845 [Nitrobacteraceae bacterium AZCC 2146]
MADTGEHQKTIDAFLAELITAISSHNTKRWWDAWLYQVLVIGAAIAGFASLTFGMMANGGNDYGKWAGIIGALTSVATILSQQLHCVKAINWHERMRVELDGIRLQLIYEHQSIPSAAELSDLSKQLRNVKLKMAAEWERATSGPGPKLGGISLRGKNHSKEV